MGDNHLTHPDLPSWSSSAGLKLGGCGAVTSVNWPKCLFCGMGLAGQCQFMGICVRTLRTVHTCVMVLSAEKRCEA